MSVAARARCVEGQPELILDRLPGGLPGGDLLGGGDRPRQEDGPGQDRRVGGVLVVPSDLEQRPVVDGKCRGAEEDDQEDREDDERLAPLPIGCDSASLEFMDMREALRR